MAKRSKSGLKRLRQSQRRRLRNQAARSRVRTLTKRAAAGGEAELRQAIAALDKTAAKGIIHKNTAARKKSRLMRRFLRAAAGAP